MIKNEELSSIVESGSRLVKFVPKLERPLNAAAKSEVLLRTECAATVLFVERKVAGHAVALRSSTIKASG